MSIRGLEMPFATEGLGWYRTRHEFPGIIELGFRDDDPKCGSFIIDAYTTPFVASGEPRGTYWTSIPISPKAYREEHRTQAAYKYAPDRLTIYDDYGSPTNITGLPPDLLQVLVAECVQQGLPERVRCGDCGKEGTTREFDTPCIAGKHRLLVRLRPTPRRAPL